MWEGGGLQGKFGCVDLLAEEQPLCCLPLGWVVQVVAGVGWMPHGKGAQWLRGHPAYLGWS